MAARTERARVVTAPIRIMVVIAQAERRVEVARWLDDKFDLAVVVMHRNPIAAVADLERTEPDVIIVDPETAELGFAEFGGLAVCRPELPVLMVRADGSPGLPVERFGQWHDSDAGPRLRYDIAAELVAAVRAISIEPLAEIDGLIQTSRPANTGRVFH